MPSIVPRLMTLKLCQYNYLFYYNGHSPFVILNIITINYAVITQTVVFSCCDMRDENIVISMPFAAVISYAHV